MKKRFILIGLVLLVFGGAYLALSYSSVKFIHARLKKVGWHGMTFTDIQIKPTYLSARGIRYEDPQSKQVLLTIDEIKVYPDLLSSLTGTLRIREWALLRPSFFFKRSKEGTFVGPWVMTDKAEKKREASGERGSKEESVFHIEVGRFRIEKGSVDFRDGKTEGSPAEIGLRELNLKIDNIRYPLVSLQSPIELDGKLKGETKDGTFSGKGWIDLETTDMETSFKAEGVGVRTFEPYYRRRVSAEVESGYFNLETKINLRNKTIDAPGQLELNDFRIAEGDGAVFWIPAKTVISLLKRKEGRIRVKFHVQGNMEDPQFNLQEDLLTRILISLAEELGIPIKIVGEKAVGGAVKGTGGLVEGIKSLEDLFRRKKEKGR